MAVSFKVQKILHVQFPVVNAQNARLGKARECPYGPKHYILNG
jgi:hypothetical protein